MTDLVLPDLSALPAGFVWGTATSSFQIEGDPEGRGDSIWDQMCREPGRIADGTNGLVACDHVRRVDEDVKLMADLGVGAYRFSISWPRVQPGGSGGFSTSGLDFYSRLVDQLLAAGVDPWVTLYHWDLPTELQTSFGGWTDRSIVDRFTEYALGVHDHLGDRVHRWTTHNEPWCAAWLGYGNGIHAPGIADHAQGAKAQHHLLLAHGRALTALRAQASPEDTFGIVLNVNNVRPADGVAPDATPEFAEALRIIDGVHTRSWLDPLLRGEYPADILELHGEALTSVVRPGDLEEISQPMDFLGVNYYADMVLVPVGGAADPNAEQNDLGRSAYPGARGYTAADPGERATTMGWPVTADGLRSLLVRIREDHPNTPPFYITENGSAYPDDPQDIGPDGLVEDPARAAYLVEHLEALARAAAEGVDVRGYFAWSLLDNFEWSWGYTQRFGIVNVDFETQKRTPKRTYDVYRRTIAAHRAR